MCNLSCEYCFASEKMVNCPNKNISMSNVQKVIEFFKRSDYRVFRMMGGEPTMHPRFQYVLELALNEEMRVDLLSNATWNHRLNDIFARISPNRLLFLLNIDHPDNYSLTLWKKIEKNLNALKGRRGISLSFNIFKKKPKYEYVLELIENYEISTVRLSFSLPVLGINNAYLESLLQKQKYF